MREGRRYDGSCDFYAFGVVLYELLCRYVPSKVKEYRARLILEEAMMGGGGGRAGQGGAAVKPFSPTDDLKQQKQQQQREDPEAASSPDSSSSLDLDELFDPRLTRKSKGLSPACIDLLTGLLQPNPTLRLGSRSPQKWDEVKSHEWFAPIDWDAAAHRRLTPPFIPNVAIANCDPVWELEEQIMGGGRKGVNMPALTAEEQAVFGGWEFGVRGDEVEGAGMAEGGKGEAMVMGTAVDLEAEEELKAKEWGVREEEVKVGWDGAADGEAGGPQFAAEVGYEERSAPPHQHHENVHDGDPSYITQG